MPGCVSLLAAGELRGLAFEVVLAAGGSRQFVAVRRGSSHVGQLPDRASEHPQQLGVALAE